VSPLLAASEEVIVFPQPSFREKKKNKRVRMIERKKVNKQKINNFAFKNSFCAGV